MTLIYIAGPYTVGDTARNIKFAAEIAMECWMKGYAVICPHTNTANFEKMSLLDYDTVMRGCLRMIDGVDAVVLIPGWTKSRGAKVEKKYALKNKIPVFIWPDLPPMK